MAGAYRNSGPDFILHDTQALAVCPRLARRVEPAHTLTVPTHAEIWTTARPSEGESLKIRVKGNCMAPALQDGDSVTLRGGRPMPGDIVAVRGLHQTRVHRYLGPVLGIDDRQLCWRLLTCADDTTKCDPLAESSALIGIVDARVCNQERVAAVAYWLQEVGRRTFRKAYTRLRGCAR